MTHNSLPPKWNERGDSPWNKKVIPTPPKVACMNLKRVIQFQNCELPKPILAVWLYVPEKCNIRDSGGDKGILRALGTVEGVSLSVYERLHIQMCGQMGVMKSRA